MPNSVRAKLIRILVMSILIGGTLTQAACSSRLHGGGSASTSGGTKVGGGVSFPFP